MYVKRTQAVDTFPICAVCGKVISRGPKDSEGSYRLRVTCRPADQPGPKAETCAKIHATKMMQAVTTRRLAGKAPSTKAKDPHATYKKQQTKAWIQAERDRLNMEQWEKIDKPILQKSNVPMSVKIYSPEEIRQYEQQYLQR